MSVQQSIAHDLAREKIGSELKLLVDQPHIARTEGDAAGCRCACGFVQRVRLLASSFGGPITGSRGYDLLA